MHSVKITYCDASQLWDLFYQNISNCIPLTNVGKSVGKTASLPASPSPAPGVFPSVDISFLPFRAELLGPRGLLGQHEMPLVHLFLASCEDIDMYRSEVRPKLIAWLESMPNRRNLKLVVIFFENASLAPDSGKANKAVLADKIRFDFNDKAALNVVTLKHQSGGLLAGIPECIEQISDALFASANMHLAQLDEETRKIDALRNLPGWNYCKFFITKEEKLLLNLSLGLSSEALIGYDELEAVYFEIADSGNEDTCFDSKLPPKEVINGADLFDLDSKTYREQMLRNDISSYDFGVYLFTRQAMILAGMMEIRELLRRAKRFFCGFAALAPVSKHRRSVWIFDAVIKTCRYIYSQNFGFEYSKKELVDLLLLAESQIEIVHSDADQVNCDAMLEFDKLSLYSELETFDNLAVFKLSVLNWCKNALSPQSAESLICSLRLAKLLFDLKVYDHAASTCEEMMKITDAVNWPTMKLQAFELAFKTYKQTGDDLKLVECAFEYLRLCSDLQIGSGANLNDIEAALLRLTQDIRLDFTKYFDVNDVSVVEDNSRLCLRISLEAFVNIKNIPVSLEACFSGEELDMTVALSNVFLTDEAPNILNFPIYNADSHSGAFKLKSFKVATLKLSWEYIAVNLDNPFEVNISPFHDIDIKCRIPDNFQFDRPSIILDCFLRADNIKEVSFTANCFDFNLFSTPEGDSSTCTLTSPENGFQCQFYASRFISGDHKIRFSGSYTTNDDKIRHCQIWARVSFPEEWKAEGRKLYLFEDKSIISLQITPASRCFESFKLVSIALNEDTAMEAFEHEVGTDVPINYSFVTEKDPRCVIIGFIGQDMKTLLYRLPVKIVENLKLICSCKPSVQIQTCYFGVPVKMVVTINTDTPISYTLDFDTDSWLISGACSGTLGGNQLEFDAFPVKTGVLLLPSISFTDCGSDIHLTSMGSTIRCISKV